MPGVSVFAKDAAGDVFHTYSSYARGLDILVGAYNVLDLVPKGRDEDGFGDHHGLGAPSRSLRARVFRRSGPDLRATEELRRFLLEPIAAVGQPPAQNENRDGGSQRPPEWQNEISDQPQGGEDDAKDFPFHDLSL